MPLHIDSPRAGSKGSDVAVTACASEWSSGHLTCLVPMRSEKEEVQKGKLGLRQQGEMMED